MGLLSTQRIVGENAGIGMGAILSVRSEIGQETVVAEGAVVKQGQSVPASIVVAGNPAKKARDISAKDRDFWAYSTKGVQGSGKEVSCKRYACVKFPCFLMGAAIAPILIREAAFFIKTIKNETFPFFLMIAAREQGS